MTRPLPAKIILVELEPPTERLFTARGAPAERLLGAMNQIRTWRNWITANRQYFSSSLLRHFSGRVDPVYLRESLERHHVIPESYIFIGRREMIPENDPRKLWHDDDAKLTIQTYDTFLDIARDGDADMIKSIAGDEAEGAIRETRRAESNG